MQECFSFQSIHLKQTHQLTLAPGKSLLTYQNCTLVSECAQIVYGLTLKHHCVNYLQHATSQHGLIVKTPASPSLSCTLGTMSCTRPAHTHTHIQEHHLIHTASSQLSSRRPSTSSVSDGLPAREASDRPRLLRSSLPWLSNVHQVKDP